MALLEGVKRSEERRLRLKTGQRAVLDVAQAGEPGTNSAAHR